jgi:hypothetical protein
VPHGDEQNAPVRAKVILIDAESMTVTWMNEAAAQDVSNEAGELVYGLPLDQAVPIAELLGVPGALRAAMNTGVAQHLNADLVSTAKGSMLITASVYRLPDGKLLLLMEHAWRAGRGRARES